MSVEFWQCLWGSVGLQYNKKKYSQCLWGSLHYFW